MTTFFCDLRVARNTDQNYWTVSVEVPAPDLQSAVQMLMAYKAGLSIHPNYDSAGEESVYNSKRRGVRYLTMREGSKLLQHFMNADERALAEFVETGRII